MIIDISILLLNFVYVDYNKLKKIMLV